MLSHRGFHNIFTVLSPYYSYSNRVIILNVRWMRLFLLLYNHFLPAGVPVLRIGSCHFVTKTQKAVTNHYAHFGTVNIFSR